MKTSLQKFIGFVALMAILINNSVLGTFAQEIASSGDSVSSYDSGNQSLNKVLSRYEKTIRTKNDLAKIKNFVNEIKNIKSKKVSEDFKNNLLQDQVGTYSNINLKNDVSSKFKNSKDQALILKQLIGSVNKTDKGIYRLFIRTSLTQTELTDLFSFFDNTELKKITTENSKDVYELKFSNKGRLAKFIGTSLNNGEIPANLFDNIETIKPVTVEGLVSTGTYLSGETLANLWGMKTMGATEYQYGLSKGTKVKVGVIDTGINKTHPDLSSNLGAGVDAGYNYISYNTNPEDDHGHGTHVSGIIGATVNGRGVFGVDSNVTIVPLKVLDSSGYGSSYSIVDAINYAANNGVKVINLSLGGTGDPSNDIMCNAITYAKSVGTISIVAAGNSNQNVSTSVPAGCSDAITVGAVDSNLNKASFSNYGAKVDVAAPGVAIYSTYLNGGYANMNGTSMATPYIAGLTAAIASYNPSITTEQVRTILKDTNNTVAVNSSVNIGRFPSMSKIMTSLGVQDDSKLDNVPTPVYTPVLSLSGSKLSANNYRVTASASLSGGTIASYQFFNSGVLLQSGSLNTYDITITQDTTVTVKVVGDNGQSASSDINLTYEFAPIFYPVLSLSGVELSTNTYRITATASVTGGTIKSYQFYNSGVLLQSGATNTYQLTITKDTTITVKVVDNNSNSATSSINLTYRISTPILNLASTELSTNTYRITVTASVTGGTIKSYQFYNSGVLLQSGTTNTYQLTITKDTTITVKIVDNNLQTVSKNISLTYKVGTPNNAPTVNLSYSQYLRVFNKTYISASDSDGKLASVEIYVNGKFFYRARPNSKSYSLNVISSRFYKYTFKVIAKDDKGAITEKSIIVK